MLKKIGNTFFGLLITLQPLFGEDVEFMYQSGQYQKIANLAPDKFVSDEQRHFLALSLKKLHRYQEALNILDALPPSSVVMLDKAYIFYDMGNLKTAREIASTLLKDKNAYVLLTQIALDEGDLTAAENEIAKIDQLPQDTQLKHEKWLLLGDLEFRRKNYLKSITWLEKALPSRNADLAPWTKDNMQMLCQAYLHYLDDPSLTIGDKKNVFNKAEALFTKAAAEYPDILSYVDIADLYCAKAKILNDPKALQAARDLIDPIDQPHLKAEAYLVLGKHAADTHQFLQAAHYFELAGNKIYQIQSLQRDGTETSLNQCSKLIAELETSSPSPLLQLLKIENQMLLNGDEDELLSALDAISNDAHQDSVLMIKGSLLFRKKEYSEAKESFDKLIALYPSSTYVPDALYWAARSNPQSAKPYYTRLYETYPQSIYAAEAYFYIYDTQDYLTGDKHALKHLKGFKAKFQNTPLLLTALYLEGMDALRDRRSLEGKWISHKNLITAIDCFQEVEIAYERLLSANLLPEKEKPQWASLKLRAKLERAKANYAIAEEAQAAKKQIYLKYAQEVFLELLDQPQFKEEATYYLARTQFDQKDWEKANATLQSLIQTYPNGYYAMKSHELLAKIWEEQGNLSKALAETSLALKTAQDEISTDEKLTLMICKAILLQKMGQLDQAMRTLSEVANYQAVSSLRLKALYLRAAIYKEQGRTLLSKKQLESLALKGGVWAAKAKELLEKEYGYD